MSYQVLYRAYRPSKFSEVVGQSYITKTLQNQIRNNKIANAYLFCGPRGTGKTSVAKIFAKAINCTDYKDDVCDSCDSCIAANKGTNADIIELDAASNNSVEDIREITKYVSFAPVNGKYKVYIIDEVHMLSTSAFNAFLKTLEEPPAHAVFILATTEPNKVLPTILSRCQRYNFSKLRPFELKQNMTMILDKEGIKYQEEALDIIAGLAEGGMRDALSILEQYLAYNREEVRVEDVEKLFSLSRTKDKIEILEDVHSNKVTTAITKLRELYQKGININRLTNELLEIVKDALIYSDSTNDSLLEKINKLEAQQLLSKVNPNFLLKDIEYLEDVLSKARPNQSMLSYLELALIKMGGNKVNKTIFVEDKPVASQEVKPEPAVKKKEEPVEEKVIEVQDEQIELGILLNILKTASKDEKINDEIIINRLEMYRFDEKKRKFYALLESSKLFASSRDAIIITVPNKARMNAINERGTNEELFNFVSSEYNTNKMIYAIDSSIQATLIDMYRKLTPEERSQVTKIEKYEIKKEETKEDKLRNLFGDLKVED